MSYNDGYHIVHHVNGRMHWSELPGRFAATLEQHAERGALCFVGISFFEASVRVGLCLVGGRILGMVPPSLRQACGWGCGCMWADEDQQ